MQDRNGEKLKSVYSDSTGFDYVRQQLVDKILKPHGIPPDAYDAMLTGDIFAKLTAKSGLATLRSIGGTDSGYQFFSVTSSDVTRAPVENDGRRISRSFLARFVDQFVHDLQNRKPGSVKQTSRGTKRMGNTGFRHYYKDDVDSIVSWMQQQLETREIDLKAPFTTKPQPRVDILDDLIASFAEGIGAPEDGEMVKALLDKPRSTDALRIITYAFTEKTKPAGAKPGTYDGGSILIGAAMKAVNEELEPDEQIRSMKLSHLYTSGGRTLEAHVKNGISYEAAIGFWNELGQGLKEAGISGQDIVDAIKAREADSVRWAEQKRASTAQENERTFRGAMVKALSEGLGIDPSTVEGYYSIGAYYTKVKDACLAIDAKSLKLSVPTGRMDNEFTEQLKVRADVTKVYLPTEFSALTKTLTTDVEARPEQYEPVLRLLRTLGEMARERGVVAHQIEHFMTKDAVAEALAAEPPEPEVTKVASMKRQRPASVRAVIAAHEAKETEAKKK